MKKKLILLGLILTTISLQAQVNHETNQPSTQTQASNLAHSGISLDRLSFAGSLKKDNWGIYYDAYLGMSWLVNQDNLYTRLRLDNIEVFDTISLLGKYSFTSLTGERFQPYALFVSEIYLNYPDGEGHTAGRIQWGGGINLNIIESKNILLRLESGVDITHEIATGLPGMIFWWRNRLRGEVELIKDIRFGGAAIISMPFRKNLDHWYDYEFSLSYRLTEELSLVGSLKFFDHRVIEADSDRYVHQISFVYNL